MDCCTGAMDLGCLYSCDLIEIGHLAGATGVYILELQPDGIKVVSNTITIGNAIVFSGGYLNEDGVSVFKVIKPDGTYLSVSGKDCFQVDIKPASNPTLSDVECTPVECEDVTITINSAAWSTESDGSTENIPVQNSEATALGSKVGAVWLIPDTTYNIYIGGALTQSFTIPTLKTETVNFYP